MHILRAISVWLVIICAESIHGTVREVFLAPWLGDFTARQISVFTGMILIFAITYYFSLWLAAPNTKALLTIGSIWVILTMLFEFGLGVFVFHHSWGRVLEDYNFSRGGLMGFGILFMLFAPLLATKLRKKVAG